MAGRIRRVRDPEAERAALVAAVDRMFAGEPLRSEAGQLTVVALLAESGVRRDIAYRAHKGFLEAFQARVAAHRAAQAAQVPVTTGAS
ncbi:hypothetical protein [Streptomyces sp. NPDC050504]|uniref:hypothetical protein n=1 Tax=Streptomyces sp. NPDC050504 TaxID=3365618 RepID=UPI0037B55731